MLFAALTSAYIVRQAGGNWLEFPLPNMFFVSTAIILSSSVAMHGSYVAFKKGNETLYKGLLVLAVLLGIGFVISQYMGWNALKDMGVPLRLNPSGDFIYVVSGIHVMHVLGGIAALFVSLFAAFGLPFKVTQARRLRFEMTLIYWHFVDFLWIYLIVFWTMFK